MVATNPPRTIRRSISKSTGETAIPNIAVHRLHSQQLIKTKFSSPGEVLTWFGAVQAQDYAAAKWAVAQRTQRATDQVIEALFASGEILRTHLMRPTWHFVSPEDIRWIVTLTAPRVIAAMAYYDRKLELDWAVFSRSHTALAHALEGGKQLNRSELISILEKAGIPASGQRFAHLLMRAELDRIVCSGARRGKQFTYALLEERAPQARALEREEALAELARRYFTSHGPATLEDYKWWSGLASADARAGLEMVKSKLISETVDAKTYWSGEPMPPAADGSQAYAWLPNFDEYLVGYANRSASFNPQSTCGPLSRDSILSNHSMAIGGQIIGTWKRTFKKGAVIITATPFSPLTRVERLAFADAARRYGEFLGMPVMLSPNLDDRLSDSEF